LFFELFKKASGGFMTPDFHFFAFCKFRIRMLVKNLRPETMVFRDEINPVTVWQGRKKEVFKRHVIDGGAPWTLASFE